MAINSYGYPNTIAPGSDFARVMGYAGHQYAVAGFSDFRVTVGSGTRRVNIAAGWAFGKGVAVQNTASTTYDLPAPSGTTQWMLVGLKRWNGSSPYTSIITHVLGTATRAVPAVTQTPGTNDTQWLALCRVTSADTAVQEIVDLRLISTEGSGFYVTLSDLAYQQLNNVVGAHIYRAETTGGNTPAFYKRVIDGAGVLSWKNMTRPETVLEGLAATQVPPAGWSRISEGCRLIRNGNHRSLVFNVRRSAGSSYAFSSNGRGGMGDVTVVAVHTEDRPGSGMVIPLMGRLSQAANSANYAVFAHLSAAGNIIINSMLPNVDVVGGDEFYFAGEWYVS
jgi:hypothetical protein